MKTTFIKLIVAVFYASLLSTTVQAAGGTLKGMNPPPTQSID